MYKGQMTLLVMIMGYAVVKSISSMTNVIHVQLGTLTFLLVKVNANIFLISFFYFNLPISWSEDLLPILLF